METDYTGKTERNVEITKDTVVTGMIVGDVVISNNATLTLRGMVVGNVTVTPGSTLDVPGTIVGKIIDNGGRVNKTGMVIEST